MRGRRRFAWLCVASAVVLLQVTEEVLGNESTMVDRTLLIDIHDAFSPQWQAMFGVATLTASARFLMPVVGVVSIALCIARRWFDAALLTGTTLMASLVVYVAKTSFGRARPQIWDTQWYWGSSFPSGHTLSAAAVATAMCLVVSRLRPEWQRACVVIAIAWVAIVALSRLVLGVHWPTDVVAAACAGLLTAAGMHAALRALVRVRA